MTVGEKLGWALRSTCCWNTEVPRCNPGPNLTPNLHPTDPGPYDASPSPVQTGQPDWAAAEFSCSTLFCFGPDASKRVGAVRHEGTSTWIFTHMDHGMGWSKGERRGWRGVCGATGMNMPAASSVTHFSFSSLAQSDVRMTRTRLEGLRVSPPVLYDS